MDIEKSDIRIDTTKLKNGTRIGQYEIISEIDRGGMAVVYKAKQLGLEREVALKILPPTVSVKNKFIERFTKEARAVAQLNHSNIIKIIEVGMEGGIYFIAMEYVVGLNLYKYMVKFEPTVYTVVQIIRKIAHALEYAHSRNIIHRDLKLNNVIMHNNSEPILIDFGLAKARETETELTISGEIIGSPSYMSPEQASGKHVDERTDIYSLGVMFYELLTSKNPFFDKRGYEQTILNVLKNEFKSPREISDWIPKDIDAIVLKSLDKDRDKRYKTMRAFRMDLERYQSGEPIIARTPNYFDRVVRRIKKRKAAFVSSAIIAFLISVFALYYRYEKSLEETKWDKIKISHDIYRNLDRYWTGFKGDSKEEIKFLNIDSPWIGTERNIQVLSDGYTWILWDNNINTDIRIDFVFSIKRSANKEFGCFIQGNSPQKAYTLGFNNGRIILSRRSKSNIVDKEFYGFFKKDDKISVSFQKSGYNIRSYINNDLVIDFDDFTPISGHTHNSFGFYVENSGINISNLKIYRQSIPFKTKPIDAAERFFNKGYFLDAIDEYRRVIELYPQRTMSVHAQYKIGLSFFNIGEYERAVSEFEKVFQNKNPKMHAHALRQIAICYSKIGDRYRFKKNLLRLKKYFPHSTDLITVLSEYNNEIISLINIGKANTIKAAKEKIDFLVENFIEYGDLYLSSYIAYGDYLIKEKKYNKAKNIFKKISSLFKKQTEECALANLRIADIESYKGNFKEALQIYNLILSKHHNITSVCAEAWFKIGNVYRSTNKREDAIKCYNFVVSEYAYQRSFTAQALLATAFCYLEKEKLDNIAMNIFNRIKEKYRDMSHETAVAKFMTDIISPFELKRVLDTPIADYYIAEKYRFKKQNQRALLFYKNFIKNVRGNKLLTKLAEKQLALLG